MTMTMPDLPHPLDETLDSPETRDRFRIDDDSAAAWAMRKLRAIRAKKQENEMIAADEIDRIRGWLASVSTPLDRDAAYFEGLLIDYAARVRENPADGRKSISLPTGTVSSRQSGDKWTVDAGAFLPWARANHPDLIRIKEEPATAAIKEALVVAGTAAVTADGEIVPGVSVAPGAISYTVNPDNV